MTFKWGAPYFKTHCGADGRDWMAIICGSCWKYIGKYEDATGHREMQCPYTNTTYEDCPNCVGGYISSPGTNGNICGGAHAADHWCCSLHGNQGAQFH